jgi:hypothetical protein
VALQRSRPKKRCFFGLRRKGNIRPTSADFPLSSEQPTLTLPIRRPSLLARYRDKKTPVTDSDPHRFIRRKMGLTATEFENRLTNEIDELLLEIDRERRQALLKSSPLERVLSKEDCHGCFKSLVRLPLARSWAFTDGLWNPTPPPLTRQRLSPLLTTTANRLPANPHLVPPGPASRLSPPSLSPPPSFKKVVWDLFFRPCRARRFRDC